ncbi:hypothetical protein ACUY4R_004565 [Kosakonia sp. BK9b]
MHRNAVRIPAWFELITQSQLEIALMPEIRVVQLADTFCPFFDQHALLKIEQVRRFATGFFPPAVEMTCGDHLMADALIVKLKQRFVIDQNVASARFMLQLFHFGAQLQIVAEKGMARLPVTLNERMANKQLTA